MLQTEHTTGNATAKVEIGPSLYVRVRAALLLTGTTLNGWCTKNGIARQYAEAALQGRRNGPKARALRQQLMAAAGIDDASID